MANSPLTNSDGVLSYTVYSEGKNTGDNYRLVSAWVRLEINRIGKAILKFTAGSMPEQKFAESDADVFKPGKKIRLDAGRKGVETTLFEGLVVKLGLELGERDHAVMVVECRDCAFPATLVRKNRIFEKKKDSEVISAVMGAYGKVSVDTTAYQHSSLVQYYCTDWDFMLSRADANGLLVAVSGNNITVKKPAVNTSPILKVTYGVDMIDFRGEVSASDQFQGVEALAWSLKNQELIKKQASSPKLNKQGNLGIADLAEGDKMLLQTDTPLENGALAAWADSIALKTGLARFRGTFSFCGNGSVIPGCIIELSGMGARFNGSVFVGTVEHSLKDDMWTTTVGMGISPDSITSQPDVVIPPASGWVPGIEGLHIGKVKKLDGDPAKEERILVEIPCLSGEKNELWARLALLYAGNGYGSFFIPEPGDEVVVGFFNNDPAYPVVLGSMFSSARPSPYEITAENKMKAFITKSKLKIEFDEEKKIIRVETPAKNIIEVSDDGKCIRLADQNKNEMLLDSSGMTLTSAKDIVLKAKSNIVLDATSKVEIKAKADVALEGMNVKANAKTGFTAKGNATAELSASGQTVVKGGVVMIN